MVERESWPICQQVHPRSANADTLIKMGDFSTFTGVLFNLTRGHTSAHGTPLTAFLEPGGLLVHTLRLATFMAKRPKAVSPFSVLQVIFLTLHWWHSLLDFQSWDPMGYHPEQQYFHQSSLFSSSASVHLLRNVVSIRSRSDFLAGDTSRSLQTHQDLHFHKTHVSRIVVSIGNAAGSSRSEGQSLPRFCSSFVAHRSMLERMTTLTSTSWNLLQTSLYLKSFHNEPPLEATTPRRCLSFLAHGSYDQRRWGIRVNLAIPSSRSRTIFMIFIQFCGGPHQEKRHYIL